MEFEFRRNTMTGTVLANFSMDHEAMGVWLTDELSDDREKYDQIIDTIARLQSGKQLQWRLVGKTWSLELDDEQVRVFANALEMGDEYELDEAMSFYDCESEAFCGLEDFAHVLSRWREFLDEAR